MRRLIISRGLWVALAAAAVTAAIVVIARSRRRPTARPVRQDEAASPATQDEAACPAPPGNRPVTRWPPVPVLGTPSAEDLKRYAAKSSVFDRPAFARIFTPESAPREPLDEATRRRLTRWSTAGAALLLLAVGTQVLETAVFSKEPEVEALQEVVVAHGYPLPDGRFGGIETGYPSAEDRRAQEPIPGYGPASDPDCRPENAAPRVRKLDAKVDRAVDRQWQRIEAWLKANAPRSYRTLGKPGDAEAIAAAEARMGVRFPDDVRASLLRHDGVVPVKDTWGFGFLGNENLSVRAIQDTWRMLCEIDGEDHRYQGYSDPRTEWWDGRMIPFGSDGMGDHLVIDSVRRDVGDTDHEGVMSFTPGGVRIRSYLALLKATADAMENGGSIGYWRPRAVDGELDWQTL